MTANRRIFLNIVATYGRSLYALVIGLFCGRWALMALGEVDYGLMGLVGGMVAFVSFLNGIMSSAVSRFYAISVGGQKVNGSCNLDECRAWFSTAVVIHTILPLILIVLGYPTGEWVIRNFLTIPLDRIVACVWVWRFVCCACFLSMISIAFNAMYSAHQYIAELTIYSFVTTSANAFFLYYMVSHPGMWLVNFAFWQMLLGVLPNIVIAIRACYLFPECRLRFRHINFIARLKELFGYGFWNAWGSLGVLFREQGVAVLVNRYFGPRVNSGLAIGVNLSGHCNTLSGSLVGAFAPAICNAWGGCDYNRAKKLAYLTCKMSTLFVLIFAIPLALEIDVVLHLWLGCVPAYAAGLCIFILVTTVVDKLSVGHVLCVCANGNIARYQAFIGTLIVLTLPIAWLFVVLGVGVYSVGWAMVLMMVAGSLGRVWFARSLVGMSAKYWFSRILTPLLITMMGAIACGFLPRLSFDASFARVCMTTLASEFFLVVAAWVIIFDADERAVVMTRLRKVLKR